MRFLKSRDFLRTSARGTLANLFVGIGTVGRRALR